MSIFGLGFIRGASDRYQQNKAAEQEAKAAAAAKAAEQEFEMEKMREQERIRATAVSDQANREREWKLADEGLASAIEAEDQYQAQQRLIQQAEEINANLPEGAKKRAFVMGDTVKIESIGAAKETKTSPRTIYLTGKGPNGDFTTTPFTPNEEGSTAGERVRNGVLSYHTQFGPQMDTLYDGVMAGDEDAIANFEKIRAGIATYSGKDMVDSLLLSQKGTDEAVVSRTYTDPSVIFNVNQYSKRPEVIDWWKRNVTQPLLVRMDESARSQRIGALPAWSRDVDGKGNARIRPDLQAPIASITGYSSVDFSTVITTANSMPAPQSVDTAASGKAKVDMLNKKINTLKPALVAASPYVQGGNASITRETADTIQEVIANMGTDYDAQIKVVRLGLQGPADAIGVQTLDGSMRPVTASINSDVLKDKAGYTRDEAQRRQEASVKVIETAEAMQQLLAEGVTPGAPMKVQQSVDAFRNIVNGMAKAIDANMFTEDAGYDASVFEGMVDQYQNILTITDEQARTAQMNSLFQLLGTQLAYQAAVAWQGGDGGRSVSNFDVEEVKAALNLDAWAATPEKARATLGWMRDQAEYNRAYNAALSGAQSLADVRAVVTWRASTRAQQSSLAGVMRSSQFYSEDAKTVGRKTGTSVNPDLQGTSARSSAEADEMAEYQRRKAAQGRN